MAWFRKSKLPEPLYITEAVIYLAGAANELSNTDLNLSLTQAELFTKRLSELEDGKKERRRETTTPTLQTLICFLLLPWLPKDPIFFYIATAIVGLMLLTHFALGTSVNGFPLPFTVTIVAQTDLGFPGAIRPFRNRTFTVCPLACHRLPPFRLQKFAHICAFGYRYQLEPQGV